MRPETHRQALLATARVAMAGALLVSCGPTKTTPTSAAEGAAQACEGVINEVCCQAAADAVDKAQLEDGDMTALQNWEDRGECCDLLNWTGSMACTPWGPPTPPRMPSRLA